MEMRITIIGMGLIGGSLGLALKQAGWNHAHITGYVRKRETGLKAVVAGAADAFETDIKKAVRNANLIIIATPVFITKDIFTAIAPFIKRGCVVTDVASTKQMIMQWAEEILPPSSCFIGGHPMVGKELSGIDAAEPELFNNCTYCLVKGSTSTDKGMLLLQDMIRSIGANPLLIEADKHDFIVAGISNLPLIASMVLIKTTASGKLWSEMSKLAASGYRDVTRLASGDPDMHTQICLSNREALVKWIDAYIRELKTVRNLINDNDSRIKDNFTSALMERNKWLKKRYPHLHV